MKKIVFILLWLLVLTWCWEGQKSEEFVANDTYLKGKECTDYRNEYLNYLHKKLHLEEWEYIDEVEIFYSEPFDKCVASYEVITNDSYAEYHEYLIDDVFNDEHLYRDSDYLLHNTSNSYEDNLKEIQEHREHNGKWITQVHKYRTWKTYEQEREELEKEL